MIARVFYHKYPRGSFMIKKFVIRLIQWAIYHLDPTHRNMENISMDNIKKFTHVELKKFQSDFGTVDTVMRTVPYETWILRTKSFELIAADKHRVVDQYDQCVWLEDLKPGDIIRTKNGLEPVVEIRNLHIRVHHYCLHVTSQDENNHLFYANDILSHNTTCSAAYILWRAMFVENQTILIVANMKEQALEIVNRVKEMYEELPHWLAAGAITYNKGTLEFDTGTRILSRATSANSARGLSVDLLYIDEFDFVPPRIAQEFWTSVRPTLAATKGDCIITSTPLSDEGEFAKIWFGANTLQNHKGLEDARGIGINGFRAFKSTWRDVPERTPSWAELEIQQIGMTRFLREYECEFVGYDNTLIDNVVMQQLTAIDPETIDEFDVRWYSDIEPNKTYIIGYDPSSGIDRDLSAIQVLRIPDMVQVAEWCNSKVSMPDQVKIYKHIINKVFYKLKTNPNQIGEPEVYWSFEQNGGWGETVINLMRELGEDTFLGYGIKEKNKTRLGLYTTGNNKLTACMKLKQLIERRKLTINSKAFLSQLKNFVTHAGSFAAKQGQQDDLVMAMVICVRILERIKDWDDRYGIALETAKENKDEPKHPPMPMIFG